ncbi:MAG: hypothetical protein V5A45_14345 [Haloarculaceae archaeon]
MSNSRYDAGTVFWAPDPYNAGSDPRPWLVLAADSLPFAGEEYICAGLTLSDLSDNLEVGEHWIAGRHPEKTSYCSPWVLATVKHDAVVSVQGSVTAAFVERVIRRSVTYLTADIGISA